MIGKSLVLATFFVVSWGASATALPNLVVNGDFEAGNTGFSSEYNFEASGSDAYFIVTNQSPINPGFASYGDHTTGASNMMHVNGATIANRVVWSEVLPVVPNSDYDVSYWARLAHGDSPPSLRFAINGAQVGSTFGGISIEEWSNFTATWNSGGATSATLRLFDDNLSYGGNDFALDDFSFIGPSAVPEPSSLALSAVGAFAVASSALRRRLRSRGKATTSSGRGL